MTNMLPFTQLRRLLPLLFVFGFLGAGPLARRTSAEPVEHFRTLGRPNVLMVVADNLGQLTANAWEEATGARITVVQLDGDSFKFHLCDKPLEPVKADTDYADARVQAYAEDRLAHLHDYDLVMVNINPKYPVNAQRTEDMRLLADYVRTGGRMIFINLGWEISFAGTPLADVMPVKVKAARGSAWVHSPGTATDFPLVRGIPLETMGEHFYGPIYSPYDATSVALTNHPNMAQYWYRETPGGGKVAFLFQDAGARTEWGYSYNFSSPERPDDSLAWRMLTRRLVYGMVYGDRAFPMPVRIVPAADATAHDGLSLTLPVDVENRSGEAREVEVRLKLSTRRSPETLDLAQKVSLSAGERRTLTFDPTVDLPCSDAFVLARATVVSADGTEKLGEADSWLPFAHTVPVQLSTDRDSYRNGDPVKAAVTWKGGPIGKYSLELSLADWRGRVLQRRQIPAEVGPGPGTAAVPFSMPAAGPELCFAYYLTAMLRSGSKVLGCARRQVQLDDPWTMRRQMQFSVWTGGGGTEFETLLRDAGFNALGCSGSVPNAERYNMHQYVEGAGVNTFSVTIDHDNWPAVRAGMDAGMDALDKIDTDSRSKSLVSLGEESGFSGGWGTRYYWTTPQAPAIPQKVFDGYLAELYAGDIARLNEEWGSHYAAFADVPLLKSNMSSAAQVFISAQAWSALDDKAKTGKFPVNFQHVDATQPYLARTAPLLESNSFFDWYYQKYCDLAVEAYRTRRNPVPRSFMSAPGGFYPKVDAYNFNGASVFLPKEETLVNDEIARRDYGDVPGTTGAAWLFFDLKPLWDSLVYSDLLVDDTHFDFWVDFPLTFNPDLTHTRATEWTKDFRHDIHAIEPLLLHKRIAYTPGLGLFIPTQPMPGGFPGHFNSAVSPNAIPYSALEESGFLPRVVKTSDLTGIRLLVASHAQEVSPEEGHRIADFVRGGGTLLATPWLGACSAHGNMLTVYPASETGLDRLLGFRLLQTSQATQVENVQVPLPFDPAGASVTLASKARDVVQDIAPDVKILARYKDGTPAMLMRSVGRGRVIYLNAIYDWGGWWASFCEPPREAYRRLYLNIAQASGIERNFFIGFRSLKSTEENKGWWGSVVTSTPAVGDSVPWWASIEYTDPSGRVKYLGVMSDERSPIITANVRIADRGAHIYDLFTGHPIVRTQDGSATLTLHPGEAALWAISPDEAAPLRIGVTSEVKAGEPVTVSLRTRDDGSMRGAVIDTYDVAGQLHLEFSPADIELANGKATVQIPTAWNDAPGRYLVVATDSRTRQQCEAWFRLGGRDTALPRELYQPFPRRGDDALMPEQPSAEEFLGDLRKLREVYLGNYAGLDAKYRLSYYLYISFEPENRHGLTRRLHRCDWMRHLDAVAAALRGGEHFVLDAEDLNVDGSSGLRIDPLMPCDPAVFLDRLAALPGAHRRAATVNGLDFDVIELGAGSLVVCRSSVDGAAYLSADFAAWQSRLKAALQTFGVAPARH